MMTAADIKTMALKYGACSLIEGADSISGLVSLMTSPQGMEFCKKHSFPTIDILRQHKEELGDMNVYVDAGEIDVTNIDNVILAGDTCATARYNSTEKPFHLMVMHGAKAKILSWGYSLCLVCNIGGDVKKLCSGNSDIYEK